jgi:DNA-binding transcriptional ArsR family regulator
MTRPTDPDAQLFAALADPVRLSIVKQLAACDGVCDCDFTDCCDVSQPTVSHHLKVLREAGIVTSERKGSWIYYRLAPEAVARLRSIVGGFVPGHLVPASELARGRGHLGHEGTQPS